MSGKLVESETTPPKKFLLKKKIHDIVNHALGKSARVIHQTVLSVSLELKETVVRTYRTEHVQVLLE